MSDAPLRALARERCVPCTAQTRRLTAAEARAEAGDLREDGWTIDDVAIERTFEFRNFNAAFGFATRIALLAEHEGHHPDMEVGWGRVRVRLTTHAIGGLSRNDLVMAAKIDRLAP